MQTRTGLNPYLPLWEYIPDGEPRVFGDRLYVYGSHDKAAGTGFCLEDYVVWSAPLNDLTKWLCHGVVYRKTQDPFNNGSETNSMWAPDVCQGSDGRYYLYYCLEFVPRISIAVSDKPEGPFNFYDYVQYEDGRLYSQNLPFDPGILFEDSKHIFLYTGFGSRSLPYDISEEDLRFMPQFKDMEAEAFEKIKRQVGLLRNPSQYASCLQLAEDMKTIIKETDNVIPTIHTAEGTDFEEHPFFEASSPRKIRNKYYFIYSSIHGHELCYAVSDFPDRDFSYGGVIISNQDLGYKGNTVAKAYWANNHGGIVRVGDNDYIFYHRHTHATTFSRQGCAEKIQILEDGSIPQVEMTSVGLLGKAISAKEVLPVAYACNLMGPDGAKAIGEHMVENTPYIVEEVEGEQKEVIITNLQKNALFGIKYLEFQEENMVSLVAKGHGHLGIILGDYSDPIRTSLSIDSDEWKEVTVPIETGTFDSSVFVKILDATGPIAVKTITFK